MQNNEIARARQEIDEDNMLVGDFLTPQIIQNQSSIVYPPFGQPNFQLKTNVIHLFQNRHQFYGRAEENPHTHISRFLENVPTLQISRNLRRRHPATFVPTYSTGQIF
ncbi:Uncharacterized protein Adt_11220 [Abeliophyllum distichum]|uniref:Reverse transcriptase domain-containing protein n=1 Tax=Abeliophyllum distichum TaxID=126358 RepID=A0ABD1UM84_9LAMI